VLPQTTVWDVMQLLLTNVPHVSIGEVEKLEPEPYQPQELSTVKLLSLLLGELLTPKCTQELKTLVNQYRQSPVFWSARKTTRISPKPVQH
jgi:hypothetical protein